MRAVVKFAEGPGNIELREVERPQAGRGQVVVRVMSAGICGTDIGIYKGTAWSNPPVTLGHEYSGIVEEIGEDVSGIAVGDRVVSETAQVVCGSCEFCRSGRPLMCKGRLSIGYGVNGAFATHIVVRQEIIHKIPASISFDEAALSEPFAVALHGVWDSGNMLPTDTVLIMGPGAIGQLAAQAAKVRGATVILAGTEHDEERLKIADRLGVQITMTDLNTEKILDLTHGRGVDIAIDCTGVQAAIRGAMEVLKPLGRFVQIGLTKPDLEIHYALLAGKEISISGSFGHQWHNWEQAIALLTSGKVSVRELITGHYTLDQWEIAFHEMQAQKGIKILLHPNQ